MKLGFIGAGNMGGAIFKGFIAKEVVAPKDIYVIRNNKEALLKQAEMYSITPADNYAEVVANSDILFLAVKPVMFPTVITQLQELINKHKPLLVSMAAGLTLESIGNMLGFEHPIVRIMPNINAEICMSTTAYCGNSLVTQEQLETIHNLFSAIGMAVSVPENQFAIFTAIAGCSPAYVYLFIDSLAKGAQKAGMNKKQALDIAASAVLGSTQMLINSDNHPWELIDKVCSPGGTTIEGVCTLEEYKFESAVVKAVENSINKDKALNKGK